MFQAPSRHSLEYSYAVYREPFKLGTPDVFPIALNATIADIIDGMDILPSDFMLRGTVMINNHVIPRDLWTRVRPKPHHAIVTFHLPVQGGGERGSSNKQIIAIVAALALTVLSAGVAGGLLATGGWFVAGSTSATLLAAGISLAGSLLINALITPPSRRSDSSDNDRGGRSLEPASLRGNVLEPNAPIPRVIGTRRIFPPFAFEPHVEMIGQDEFISGVFVLAGAHRIEDARIGQASIDEAAEDADISIEIDDGTPSGQRIVIPERYTRTFPINVEMSTHDTDENNLDLFGGTLPVWHATATADKPHECWLHLISLGLIATPTPTDRLRIPFRIRLRKRGDTTWRYCPELHYEDNTQSQRRMQVKFLFGQTFTSTPIQPNATLGWVMARKQVPAQNVSPVGAVWDADPYFSSGSGDDVYSSSTFATTKIINMNMTPDTVTFYLSEAEWEPGIYEIELIRGATFIAGNFTDSNYQYSGSVLDFFGTRDGLTLPMTRDGLVDRIQILRAVSVKNERPINAHGLTLIKIRARNRSVENFSVRASGYVNDWDGSTQSWTDYKTTSNPAPHYRDVLSGLLNFDPLPDKMHDELALIDWRQACIDNDYRCDLIVEGGTIAEVLRIIASCGYARPYQSEIWGVIRDYDRSSEAPVQIFTPRNMQGLSWQKAFPRLPTGLRVNFIDDEYEYSGKQIVVYRAGANETDARLEQITYDGLVRRADIIKRARYDLMNGQYRSTIYSFTAPVEAIVCRRGSLVGINHDVLLKHYGYARIAEVILNSTGDVTGIILDTPMQVHNENDLLGIPDLLAIEDILQVGLVTALGIRYKNGDINIHTLASSTVSEVTDRVIFATPIDTDQITTGCLVTLGLLGKEFKRLIVNEIEPGKDLTARLTLIDEAPIIWQGI